MLNLEQSVPKAIADKLMLSLKNLELYPESHAVTNASIYDFLGLLDEYLNDNDTLPFIVKKDTLCHNDSIVFQGIAEESNPVYQMYRDGIEQLMFHQGVTREDFVLFLKILKQHTTQRRQEESDIVTDLWGADLQNITYKTTDVFWKDEPIIDFENTRVIEQSNLQQPEKTDEQRWAVSMADMVAEFGMFELTPEEIQKTMKMVKSEEQRNFDVDLFDILLVILKEQNDKDDFALILDIMIESFKHTLEHAEFSDAIIFLGKFKELKATYQRTKDWALPYFEDFMLTISSNAVLSSLHTAWPKVDLTSDQHLAGIKKTMTALSPQAIHTLCPMILQVPSEKIQHQLLGAVQILAKKDPRPLITTLSHPDQNIVKNALFILGNIPGKEITAVLIKKLKTTSSSLKSEVVKSIAKRKPLQTKILFPLFDDPDPVIRNCILNRLSKERNKDSERFLINIIKNSKFKKGDHQLLLKIYRAIGGCGSSDSIPYLIKQQKPKPLFKSAVSKIHNEGAELALSILESATTASEPKQK